MNGIAPKGGSEALYGFDISRMNLSAQLVVLSACNTALGLYRPGEGLLSFVLSFVDGGVPSVVASLWQVDEAATKKLMVEFYRQLRKGQSYSAALARAKQCLIDNGYSDPFYWAGFVLYGKDGHFDFTGQEGFFAKIYVPMAIAIFLLLVLLWELHIEQTDQHESQYGFFKVK